MMRKTVGVIGSMVILASLFFDIGSAASIQATSPSVSAEGRVLPRRSISLSFNAVGQVAEILVKEGDTVKAGDVIARLNADELRAAVAEAEANVAVAKANQAAYQMRLPGQIAAAEAEVKAAQAQQLHASAGRDNQPAILEAEAALAQAQARQQQIQTALDQLGEYGRANGSRAGDLRVQLQSALKATQAAQAQWDALKAGSPSDLAGSAQSAAATASEKAAQARLDQYQAEAAGKAVDAYQAAIQQVEAALLVAQQALSETEIRAPFAGTIAQLNLKSGDYVTARAPVMVLADLSGWQVETKNLSESEVPLIQVGQAVTLKLDALPDAELTGRVESIGAVSHLDSGDVVYPVKIDLLGNDPRLRWGMTVVAKFE